MELGRLAGVSLPTVQNVESGRANPSLSTLESLLDALGLAVCLEDKRADWDLLSALGLPLFSKETKRPRASVELLLSNLRLAALELVRDGDLGDRERKLESFQALLLALETYFPTFYRKRLGKSPIFGSLFPDKPSGRVIKLKRIAGRALAEYM